MKLVYYTDQFYRHGGIEKVLSQKLNYFANLDGFEVYLITSQQMKQAFCYSISAKVRHIDLGIDYDITKSYFHPKNLLKVPLHIQKLKKWLKDIKPSNLIVCNYGFDFYFIPFIAKNIKTIKEFHSSRFQRAQNIPKTVYQKVIRKVDSFIELKYTYLVLLNGDEKRYYESGNVCIIPNSVRTVQEAYKKTRRRTVIAAGRIAPVKQFDHLIKAWHIVSEIFPEWNLEIYGENYGTTARELEELVKELNAKNVNLMGATDNMQGIMSEASIYALTSSTECFPMVLLESLANGLPIVSYDCPHGPRNIITEDEDGILVEADNIEQFALALSQLMNDEKGRNCMETAAVINIKRFDENDVMEKWLHLFSSRN